MVTEIFAYVFDKENKAAKAVDDVFLKMIELDSGPGKYKIKDGGLVSKKKYGDDNEDAPVTLAWGYPFELTDGDWALLSWRHQYPDDYPVIDAEITDTWVYKDIYDLTDENSPVVKEDFPPVPAAAILSVKKKKI